MYVLLLDGTRVLTARTSWTCSSLLSARCAAVGSVSRSRNMSDFFLLGWRCLFFSGECAGERCAADPPVLAASLRSVGAPVCGTRHHGGGAFQHRLLLYLLIELLSDVQQAIKNCRSGRLWICVWVLRHGRAYCTHHVNVTTATVVMLAV